MRVWYTFGAGTMTVRPPSANGYGIFCAVSFCVMAAASLDSRFVNSGEYDGFDAHDVKKTPPTITASRATAVTAFCPLEKPASNPAARRRRSMICCGN